jgi:hypothetical protein
MWQKLTREGVKSAPEQSALGSPAIALWVAHVAFWSLLLLGAVVGELRARHLVTLLLLWIASVFALPQVPYGAGLSTSCVAILDIVLVFLVFKRDLRLT